MKKEVLFFVTFALVVILITSFVLSAYPNSSSNVGVSVALKKPFVKVQITPNSVSFGEITVGYDSGSSSNITFTNKGTLDETITPELETGSDEIFDYTEFATDTDCSTWHGLDYYTNHTLVGILSKSNVYNGTGEEDYSCIRLGLSNYNGTDIMSDVDLSTNIIFWAMPA